VSKFEDTWLDVGDKIVVTTVDSYVYIYMYILHHVYIQNEVLVVLQTDTLGGVCEKCVWGYMCDTGCVCDELNPKPEVVGKKMLFVINR
jgi:hypothetical protein